MYGMKYPPEQLMGWIAVRSALAVGVSPQNGLIAAGLEKSGLRLGC
jgi:hypothetical protein